MKTILNDIRAIEDQASALITQAEQKAKNRLASLLENESNILHKVATSAQARGEQLVKEAQSKAKREANALLEDERRALAAIHTAADTNRDRTLTFITQLLT